MSPGTFFSMGGNQTYEVLLISIEPNICIMLSTKAPAIFLFVIRIISE
jgi:hypothetical protein